MKTNKSKIGERYGKLTSFQYAFLDWIEKCKQKGLKPFILKGRGKI